MVDAEGTRRPQHVLVVIDEQHRFGVAQRLALRSKMTEGGQEPHLLMMTATPIPRTLAMSYYADLDVSTLDELPPGRTPIVTKVVNEARRDEVIERIRAQIQQGRQVYWVCPLIEESEALDLTNATQTHADLAEALQGTVRDDGQPVLIGLLHSRMHVDDKKAVMGAFTAGLMSVPVPLGALMKVQPSFGPTRVTRYNGFPSADISGGPAPGYSSGQATAAIEKIVSESLPDGMTYEWTDLTYQQHLAENFANWRLVVDGLVNRPLNLSLSDLAGMPSRSQVTRHDCVEGWSAIGKWKGVQLSRVLEF